MPQLLINLLETILLETPVWWIGYRKEPALHIILFVILLNGFTLPLATFVFHHLDWNYFLVEILVVIAEFLIVFAVFRKPVWFSILIAGIANSLSASLPWIEKVMGGS